MNQDYKNTLNLPETDFQMRAQLAQREPAQLEEWSEKSIYQKMQDQESKDIFILHDGPPYANGEIHIGHAVNKVLKDIICKSKYLDGKCAPFVPGWDCHGLPIELRVEKKFGKPGRKITAEEFRVQCRKYAKEQFDLQRTAFKRLGVFGDWDHPYTTMAYTYEASVIRGLSQLFEKGYVSRHVKPVYWCTDCGSALAEAEIEYIDKNSPAIDVRFSFLDASALLQRCHGYHGDGSDVPNQVSSVIWTTTPWTLPANEAVCLHPERDYVLVVCDLGLGKEWLLVAEALLKDVMTRYDCNDYRVVAYANGSELEGLKLQHPLFDKTVPVILGDHVTADAGTGCVHTAPAHGQEDYRASLNYDLPIESSVNGYGKFNENTPLLGGLSIYAANEVIIDTLKAQGNLIKHVALNHSYPHCWRHKTPLLFRATPQWFINLDTQPNNGERTLREAALDEIAKTQWLPTWGQQRIGLMIEKHPGWCISRQRTWGVPIAIFVHKETGQPHPKTPELMEAVAGHVEEQGVEAWYSLDINTLKHIATDLDEYEKITDVLDVWFDAGLSHYAVLKNHVEHKDSYWSSLRWPADVYLEGSDQHRGWFQSSLITSCALNNQAPYKQVITHGFTVDSQGRKMSKSLGNTVAPDEVINTLGADVLRLWIASADYRGEMTVSNDLLKQIGDKYRRIRNTSRFLLANLHDFDIEKNAVPFQECIQMDLWILSVAQNLNKIIKQLYEQYEFHRITQIVHDFCSIELGSYYLDVIKDRQYTIKKEAKARRSAQTVMYHIAHYLVRWIAPILSFTAEEIWKHLPNTNQLDSVFLTHWYDIKEESLLHSYQQDQSFWQQLYSLRGYVNKLIEEKRQSGEIKSSLEANVFIHIDHTKLASGYVELLQSLNKADELRFALTVSKAQLHESNEALDGSIESAPGIKVRVEKIEYPKCARCWQHVEDVGTREAHSMICGRCILNIDGDGEQRTFV